MHPKSMVLPTFDGLSEMVEVEWQAALSQEARHSVATGPTWMRAKGVATKVQSG